MTKRSLTQSLILHALLIIPLVLFTPKGTGKGNGDGDQEGEGQRQGDPKGDFLDKATDGSDGKPEPKEVVVELITIPKKDPKVKTEGVKECKDDDWYGGIGIRHSYTLITIEQIAKGYAADKAGLKVGDRLVLINGQAATYSTVDLIRGEPGSILELTVERDGILIDFRIVREKICTENSI